MEGNPNENRNQLIRATWEGIQLVGRTRAAGVMTVKGGQKDVEREREMEMKIPKSLAASTVNETGHVSSGTRLQKKRKKKKKLNQFVRCELCHRGRDFNTNTLTQTVSEYLSTSQCVRVSG